MSADGKVVGIGLQNGSELGVSFFHDATTFTGGVSNPSTWNHTLNEPIIDISISEDGRTSAAVSEQIFATLYYWNNLTEIAGERPANWTRLQDFGCVDISGEGDSVVAGTREVPRCLHYWGDALSEGGNDVTADWISHEGETIYDVAVNDAGNIE